MSKKLLMNNYSENGLMPVMDGLICWLDGRDGKAGDTVWRDRSGNGNNAIFINNKTLFKDGKLTLHGDNYANLPFGKGEDINKHCLCAYFSKIDTANNGMAISGGLGNNQRKYLDIGDYMHPRLGYCDKAYRNDITKPNELIHCVWNAEEFVKLYVNGIVKIKVSKKEKVTLSCNYVIGTNDATYKPPELFQLKGSIGSILIYNRALTEEEIQQNYEYEQSIERG